MTKQPPTSIKVSYLGAARTAAFNCLDDAMEFAALKSLTTGTTSVHDKTGLIGQFESGSPTPEFRHLEAQYRPPYVPTTYSDLRSAARKDFLLRVEDISEGERTARNIREALDEAIDAQRLSMNGSLAEVLGSDLGLGYPTDPSILEGEDIFSMIRGSIDESLRNDLDDVLSRALRDVEPEDEDAETEA